MNIHILHGNQLEETGEMSAEYMIRAVKALTSADLNDTLIITGGVTRPGFKSEAEVGLNFINQQDHPVLPRILLEKRSTTTGENIRFVKELLEQHGLRPSKIFVYHRESALIKAKILYDQLWSGHPELVFVPCLDNSGWVYKLRSYTLMPLLAYVDPYEKNSLWRWFKRTKRNASE